MSPDGGQKSPGGRLSPAKLALRGAAAGKKGSAHLEGFFRASDTRMGDRKLKCGRGGRGRKLNGHANRVTDRDPPVAILREMIHAHQMASFGRPECIVTLEIWDLLLHHLRAPLDEAVLCHDFVTLIPISWSD